MLDLYSKRRIDQRVDAWALGAGPWLTPPDGRPPSPCWTCRTSTARRRHRVLLGIPKATCQRDTDTPPSPPEPTPGHGAALLPLLLLPAVRGGAHAPPRSFPTVFPPQSVWSPPVIASRGHWPAAWCPPRCLPSHPPLHCHVLAFNPHHPMGLLPPPNVCGSPPPPPHPPADQSPPRDLNRKAEGEGGPRRLEGSPFPPCSMSPSPVPGGVPPSLQILHARYRLPPPRPLHPIPRRSPTASAATPGSPSLGSLLVPRPGVRPVPCLPVPRRHGSSLHLPRQMMSSGASGQCHPIGSHPIETGIKTESRWEGGGDPW